MEEISTFVGSEDDLGGQELHGGGRGPGVTPAPWSLRTLQVELGHGQDPAGSCTHLENVGVCKAVHPSCAAVIITALLITLCKWAEREGGRGGRQNN